MTTPPTDCSECRLLLGGYALDALEPDEVLAVERHIASCPECARERERLSTIPMLLDLAGSADPAPAKPPATLEEAVLDRFARENPRRPRMRGLGSWIASGARLITRPLPASLAGAAVAAAVAVVIVLATSGGTSDVDSFQARLAALPAAPGATATARLVSFSDGTSVHLHVRGLHSAPGMIYEVWCARGDGAKVSAGTFSVGPSGNANVALTTAAIPTEYHKMTIVREQIRRGGWSGQRVLVGNIQYR